MGKNDAAMQAGSHLTAAGKFNFLFSAIVLMLLGSQISTCFAQSQIESRTPISSLPYAITNAGSYYVTSNLTGVASQSGISISTGDVTLDLGGFVLTGVPGSLNGIFITGTCSNILVRNGAVSGWGTIGVNGCRTGIPRNVIYEHLDISGNGTTGLDAGAGSSIRDCVVMDNGQDGIDSAGSLITGCIVRDNRLDGMNVSDSSIRACMAEFNGTGIKADRSTVADCDIMNNMTNGLTLGSACRAINNRIANHLGDPGSGIFLSGSLNYISDNAINNNHCGIYGSTTGATNNCMVENRFLSSFNTGPSAAELFPAAEPAADNSFDFAGTNSFVNLFFP